MGTIKSQRISDQVTKIIIKLISKENFKLGDKFYSQKVLSEKLGVSISSVREAMRSLEATGWVTAKHGKGVFVALVRGRHNEGFKEWLKDNRNTVLEHFEVRLMLDPKSAAYAARNATDSEIQKLRRICFDFKLKAETHDIDTLIGLDEDFHLMVAKSTMNKTLCILMKTMAESLPVGWITSLNVPGRIEKTTGEHNKIVAAIAGRDAKKAEIAMIEHLEKAREEILDFMRASQDGNQNNHLD